MPELSVIVPTYNERKNLAPLLACLKHALTAIDYEVVIVDDDSPDGTAAMARTMAQEIPRLRVIQRIGRRGLASAAVEGMLATSAPYLVVMDGDLQHDERIIPSMLAKLKEEHLDIVLGSRNCGGGSMGEFADSRVALSNLGRTLSERICRVSVSDPMSGFFLLTRQYFHRVVHNLSCVGFKLLVDLLASSNGQVRVGEVGYTFRNRVHGDSKLDIVVGFEYLQLLLDKASKGIFPMSVLLFALVGLFGMVCNIALAAFLIYFLDTGFRDAQIVGAVATVAINFLLNNRLTFRASRLRGRRIWQGLGLYYVCCSVSLVVQVAIATSLQQIGVHWATSTLAGVAMGAGWNYSMAFFFIWQVKRHRTKRLQHAYASPSWFEEDANVRT